MSNERFQTNVLLRSEQTNNQVSVIENLVPAGWGGPPLHHHDLDETFYVFEGELTFQLGEEIFTRTREELAFAPRNAHHTLANHSGGEARYVLVCTPAGFERRFDLMAAEQAGVEPPPRPGSHRRRSSSGRALASARATVRDPHGCRQVAAAPCGPVILWPRYESMSRTDEWGVL